MAQDLLVGPVALREQVRAKYREVATSAMDSTRTPADWRPLRLRSAASSTASTAGTTPAGAQAEPRGEQQRDDDRQDQRAGQWPALLGPYSGPHHLGVSFHPTEGRKD